MTNDVPLAADQGHESTGHAAGISIICVGNRYRAGDDLGCRVHDLLAGRPLPGGVALIDGGLKGLDLLRCVEGTRRAVFVDAVDGFAAPGEVVVLPGKTVAALAEGGWGHGAGLPQLFHLAPLVCDVPPAEMMLVGAEPPVGDAVVAAVAARAVAEAVRQ